MHFILLSLATVAIGPLLLDQNTTQSSAPSYSAASIVNAATSTADALAPNAIVSIYGTDLAFDTVSTGPPAILPVVLDSVRVFVAGMPANLYYVSPKQINFVIPSDLRPGTIDLFVARQGVAGPHVQITVNDAGPGFFQREPGMIAATDGGGHLITKAHPAHAGQTVVLYGTGFGNTDPPIDAGAISMQPAQILGLNELQVLVAGTAVSSKSVLYAGVSPGTPGLYQLNVVLPKSLAPNPEIRMVIGTHSSPVSIRLPVN